jgi:hypothetical protein
MDKGVNEVVGGKYCNPNIEPDILLIDWNDVIEMIDYRSTSQSRAQLQKKADLARDQLQTPQDPNLPPRQVGRPIVLDP